MQAVQVQAQAHQGRNKLCGNEGLFDAKSYINLYSSTMGSATPTINRGCPPMMACTHGNLVKQRYSLVMDALRRYTGLVKDRAGRVWVACAV